MAPTKAAKALGITKEELTVAKQGLVNKGLVYLANGGRMMANGHALAILMSRGRAWGRPSISLGQVLHRLEERAPLTHP